jgi:hypothetical protein
MKINEQYYIYLYNTRNQLIIEQWSDENNPLFNIDAEINHKHKNTQTGQHTTLRWQHV